MRNYFRGWYFRCQSEHQTLAIIASVHKTRESDFCTIQLVTDTEAFHVRYPYSDYNKIKDLIQIGDNRFGAEGITLNIQTEAIRASGSLRFGPFTPIRYDIMGPFRYVPFMECRHTVISMRHLVNGEITVDGVQYAFYDAVGYIEGDRGYSFPGKYLWTQCSFPDGALMLSVAEIPYGILKFTGVIGIVLLQGKEYRLATYLGARVVRISSNEILVRQGKYSLIVKPKGKSGHPLHAPAGGAMNRIIHEHPSSNVYYRFEKNGVPLLELDAQNAALEFEYA